MQCQRTEARLHSYSRQGMDGTAGAPFGLQYRVWRCRQLLWRDRTSIRVIALALLCCAWRLASPTCDLGPAAVASQHAAEAARAQREFWLASYVVRAATAADAAATVHAAASPGQCPTTSCRHWPLEWRITCGCWPAGSLKPGGWASGAQRLLGATARRVLQVSAYVIVLPTRCHHHVLCTNQC